MLRMGKVFPCRGKQRPCLGFRTLWEGGIAAAGGNSPPGSYSVDNHLKEHPMPLRVIHADLFSVRADALLLTIDGARRGLEGNLARQFARRHPEDWEDVEAQMRYPLALGRAACLQMHAECPWRNVLVAATLHHLDVLTDGEKALVVRRAFTEALALCGRHGVRSLASPVLRGGWRLPLERAFSAMADGWLATAPPVRQSDVSVCTTSGDDVALLAAVVRLKGLGPPDALSQ